MSYERKGFAVHETPLLSSDVVDAARQGMDAVRRGEYDTGRGPQPSPWNPGDADDVLCKIEMPQLANRAIHALVSDRDLGAWAAQVTGADWIQVWWVQLLHKPSTTGSATGVNVGWHQDRQYWGAWEEGSELFTAWVALSDVGETSGPMRFIGGSHQWGFRGEGDFFGQDLASQRDGIHVPAGQQWDETPALMQAGGASLHHCLTFHGSSENTSMKPRLSFAIHMRTGNSSPTGDKREGLTAFIDDFGACPIVYGA